MNELIYGKLRPTQIRSLNTTFYGCIHIQNNPIICYLTKYKDTSKTSITF